MTAKQRLGAQQTRAESEPGGRRASSESMGQTNKAARLLALIATLWRSNALLSPRRRGGIMSLLRGLYPVLSSDYIYIENAAGRVGGWVGGREGGREGGSCASERPPPVPREAVCRSLS